MRWPSANISVHGSSHRRKIIFDNLPVHPTGVFPVSPCDDAFCCGPKPNVVRPQTQALDLSAQPEMVARPSCLVVKMIDAPARELQDACHRHRDVGGQYDF